MIICRFCGGKGCLVCDMDRVQRLEQQRAQEETREWLREHYPMLVDAKGVLNIAPYVFYMVLQAIAYGKESVRRQPESTPEDATCLERRFAMLEWDTKKRKKVLPKKSPAVEIEV